MTHAPPDLVRFCTEQQPRLIGLLTLYCGDPDIAEELAQETLARACNRWRQVRRLSLPDAWVYRVAINLANSLFRRKRTERRVREHARSHERLVHHDPDTAASVDVLQAVAALPRRQRTAVVLRYYVDLPVAEVAEVMGCPEGTVKTLTYKGAAALRERLAAVELEEVAHDA